MKRIGKRLAISGFLLIGFLAIVAWATLTFILVRPESYHPTQLQSISLRSWPEHNEIYQETEFPYVYSKSLENGALEYVGALHTSDAQAPQLKEIESRWKQFNPTVAFCEGRKRMLRFSTRTETGKLSEADLVRILAYGNGVKLYTLEPTYEDEVAGLLKGFDAKLVATYLTLRVFTAESKDVPENERDRLALELLRKRIRVEGLRQAFTSLQDFDHHWEDVFPDEPDWRTLNNPDQVAQLRMIGDLSRELRGQHMVSSIIELVKQGERVFAVVGASHVIRQELELDRLLAR